jgi:hypothetical protein
MPVMDLREFSREYGHFKMVLLHLVVLADVDVA